MTDLAACEVKGLEKLLRWLFGEKKKVLVIAPGDSVFNVEIHEQDLGKLFDEYLDEALTTKTDDEPDGATADDDVADGAAADDAAADGATADDAAVDGAPAPDMTDEHPNDTKEAKPNEAVTAC